MSHCRLCLSEGGEFQNLHEIQIAVREAIETIFYSKIKFEPDLKLSICDDCEKTVLDFHAYYLNVVKNQIAVDVPAKTEAIIVDVKEASELSSDDEDDDLEDEPLAQLQTKKKTKMEKRKTTDAEDKIIKDFFGLICKQCDGKEFDKLSEFRAHMQTVHAVKKFLMECCSRSFRKRCQILDHAMSHMNPEKLQCSVCGKQCINRHSLRFHVMKHQPDEARKYACAVCGKGCQTVGNLKAHMRVHLTTEEKEKLKTHVCSTCGNRFALKSLLAHHVRQTHENVYSCVCDVCARSFKTKMHFLVHYKNVHEEPTMQRVQCQVCGKSVANEVTLKKHMRLTHQPGPHVCSECGKELQTKHALLSHVRYTHKASRSHKCQFCIKAFKKALQLKEHLTTHLGGVLYNCAYCEKTFNSGANMYAHRKKVHPVEWERDRKKD